jgi:uncharacterized repeat protein (TIGR01451 family)
MSFITTSRFWCLASVFLLGLLELGSAWAQAGQPLYCDAQFYQTRVQTGGTRLLRYPTFATTPVNVYTGNNQTTTIPNLGAVTLNGLGFNHRDNYLYAITTAGTAGSVNLYRIGQTGAELVGSIPGVSDPFTTTAGVFDKQGRYYFAGQGGAIGNLANTLSPSIIYRVDNIPTSGTSAGLTIARSYNVNVTPLLNFGDFAFSDSSDGINGILYGASNQITPANTAGSQHVRIQLNDAAATASVNVSTVTGANLAGTGSGFYDRPNNQFFMFSNTGNNFFRIDNFAAGTPNAVTITSVVNAPLTDATGTSDGTACILASVQAADISVTKIVTPATPRLVGQTVTFTIVANNLGPSPAQTATIADPLPAGLTLVSFTTTAGTYNTATGSWTIPNFPGSSVQTLTLVASVNSLGTTTSSFVNVASYGGSNQLGTTTVIPLTDPTPGNNTATATVSTTRAASLTIAKTDGITTATAGQTTNYTITVSLGTGTTASDVANATLRDPAAAGLQCVLGTPACTATGGSICPTVGAGAGQLSIANLQGAGGVQIPLLKPGGTMSFRISCGVTATGL